MCTKTGRIIPVSQANEVNQEVLNALRELYNAFQHDGSVLIKTKIIEKCPDIKKALNTAFRVLQKEECNGNN